MVGFLLQLVFAAAGLWLSTYVVPGVSFHPLGALIASALVLGLLNALVKPILVILTLPITIITLGLFLLVLNGVMVWIVGKLVPGAHIHGLFTSILVALIVSITSWIGGMLIRKDRPPRRA